MPYEFTGTVPYSILYVLYIQKEVARFALNGTQSRGSATRVRNKRLDVKTRTGLEAL
jgi:hypothetical protein